MDYNDYILKKNKDDLHFWFRAKNNLILNLLKRSLGDDGTKKEILDIGCGTGTEFAVLKKFGRVTALDNNTLALELAKKTGCLLRCDDIEKIEIEKNTYDIVCCFDILEHLKDDINTLKNIYASLKKNGRLFFTVPANPCLFGPHDIALGHHRRYSKQKLTAIIHEAGFKKVEINYWNSYLYPVEAIFRIVKKIVHKILKTKNAKSEAKTPPGLINNILFRVLNLESPLVSKGVSLPFGLTLYGVAKK